MVDAFTEVGLQDVTASPTPGRQQGGARPRAGPAGLADRPPVLPLRRPAAARRGRLASPVWELTERDGRWYGRGAADCKGNIVMHLTALRALKQANGGFPCTVKLICEGSEEQGTGGLEAFVPRERRPAARRHDPRRRHRQLRGRRADAHDDAARHDERRRDAPRARQRDALGHVRRAGAGSARRPDPDARRRCTTSDGNTTVDGLDATQTLERRGLLRPSSSAATPTCSTASS